jgi:hypothetical protein
MTTDDWRRQSGERPSVRGMQLAKALPPPLPRDINRQDSERVRACLVEAINWWLAEHETSLSRLAELMRCSHTYLVELRHGTRPIQPWMILRLPLSLFQQFSGLVAGEIVHDARRVSNGY